ncbi:MAG TPA: hypothetical protein VNZ52_17025 [Candidatus Thermoplasmatota archaeon]|nr:hypothetical protein [Candidatus Thermoplasmatota archaeon]
MTRVAIYAPLCDGCAEIADSHFAIPLPLNDGAEAPSSIIPRDVLGLKGLKNTKGYTCKCGTLINYDATEPWFLSEVRDGPPPT